MSTNNKNNELNPSDNAELRDLRTHASSATTLHETIETDHVVSIEAPNEGGQPGPYDAREDRFKTKSDNA